MRLLLDENVDARLLNRLIEQGHDVTSVAHDYQTAISDSRVLEIAVHEDRIVVSNDRDFGAMVFRNRARHAGVIYLRLRRQDLSHVASRLDAAIAAMPEGSRSFMVVSDRAIRVAPRPAESS